jgi:FkbM family methyltransferase
MAQSSLRRLAHRLPAPARRLGSRARTGIYRNVLGRQQKASTPGEFCFSLNELLNFLYPEGLPEGLFLDDLALAVADSLRVRDLDTVRRILAALDGPSAPTPVQIRFGPNDLTNVEANGITFVLDRADCSVAKEIIEQRSYEPEVTALLNGLLQPGMTFVDIGANVGYFTLLASRLVGPSGRVIAVEPFSENCRSILISVAENEATNVTLFPVALDEQTGWAHMAAHIGSNASFVPDQVDQIARGYGTIVPTFPLDQLMQGPVDVMKIDVEGAEGRVVSGAAELITKHRPIVVTEVSDAMLTLRSNWSMRSYIEWFTMKGYSVSIVDRNGGDPGRVENLEELLSSWSDPYRIENLLLLPE